MSTEEDKILEKLKAKKIDKLEEKESGVTNSTPAPRTVDKTEDIIPF